MLFRSVIEADFFRPRLVSMAHVAALAELAPVRIVLGVAAEAVHRRPGDLGRLLVAHLARAIRVRAVQRKLGVARVIERDVLPPGDAVTRRALGAIDTGMRVVLAVAADALLRRLVFQLVAFVAGLALEAGVASAEREAGALLMIEQRFLPVVGRMALLTLVAVRALVVIVLRVAPDARLRGPSRGTWRTR